MTPLLEIWLRGLGVVLAVMVAVWLLSLRRRDVSIVDIVWGLGFVFAAWVYHLSGPAQALAPQLLLLGLVTVWGLRLSGYIGWRNHGQGEDRRYRKMRERHGPGFRWHSLWRVFLFQGLLIGIISTPLLFALGQDRPGMRWSDWLGLALWLIGFAFEAVGDTQLARFKADPDNRGKVLDSGLWRYTRHPNYFGEAMMWWGYFAFALAAPHGWWTVPAPAIMHLFLLKVSGVALLEKDIAERRPAYRDYIERTNAFLPWPPRPASGS